MIGSESAADGATQKVGDDRNAAHSKHDHERKVGSRSRYAEREPQDEVNGDRRQGEQGGDGVQPPFHVVPAAAVVARRSASFRNWISMRSRQLDVLDRMTAGMWD
jgi:hypothetical protein